MERLAISDFWAYCDAVDEIEKQNSDDLPQPEGGFRVRLGG